MNLFRIAPLALFLLSCSTVLSEEHRTGSQSGHGGQRQTVSRMPQRPTEDPVPEPAFPAQVFRALREAYPDRVGNATVQNGEWTVRISGKLFYWADGRMLPEAEKANAVKYDNYSFRPYPGSMPELPQLSEDQIRFLQERIAEREAGTEHRNPAFMNALWGMENFDIAEQTVIPTEFLGQRIRIHPLMETPLSLVEQQILKTAAENPLVAGWVSNIGSAGAYVWRDIAGSANRSQHSYGIAIDLQPRDYKGKQAYWRWARDYYPQWWAIPYAERHPVPDDVVQAFEANGFIWGGKWLLFDQIHFEYRPELILLGKSGLELEPGSRTQRDSDSGL